MKTKIDKKTFQTLGFLILLASILLLPRLLRLGYYATADEPLYLKQSGIFYDLLSEKDFSNTDLIVHPGVLSLWSGAIGYLLKFPDFANYAEYPLSDMQFFRITTEYEITQAQLLAYGRAVSISIQTGLLLLTFFYLQGLFGKWPAIFGILIVAFDPFYFANSRILQPDGMLSTCIFLSAIAYASYLHTNRRWDLLISGAAAGLSLLSKTTGIVLVPFMIIFEVVNWLCLKPSFKSVTGNLLIWGIAAMIIFMVLWPAMWVKPLEVLSEIFQSAFTLSEEVNSPMFFNGHIIPEGEFGLEFWYFYLTTWLWRTTPFVIFGLLLGLFSSFWKLLKREYINSSLPILSLIAFVAIYILVMSISKKKFDRYLLPAHLIIDLLAGLGWIGFFQWLKNWLPIKTKKLVPAIASLIVIGQIWMTASVYPYYHSYYNPILGGAPKAKEVMMIGWGEGLDQAARYLSKQPKANKLTVYSWYAAAFKINYVYWSKFDWLPQDLPISAPISDDQFEQMLQADYVVTYINQWQRKSSSRLLDYLADKPIEYIIPINGIEYVHIYNMKEIDPQE